jgi:hypothetical protein
MSMSEAPIHRKRPAGHNGREASRIGSFLNRYSKMVAFLGATIVFSTFIVKEGWRENLKSLGDTIDTAQNIFTLRSDGVATTSQLNGLVSEVEAIRAKISGNEFGLTLPGVNRTMLVYSGELRQLRTSVDNLSSLMERLPNPGQHKEDLKRNLDQLQGEQVAFRHVGELAARAIANESADGTPSAGDARVISSAIFQLSTGISDLYRQVDNLTSATLSDAQAARTRQEKLYGIATWVSYCLYALGWVFGLVGKLYGVDGMEVSE